jgi:hypothetical protein
MPVEPTNPIVGKLTLCRCERTTAGDLKTPLVASTVTLHSRILQP